MDVTLYYGIIARGGFDSFMKSSELFKVGKVSLKNLVKGPFKRVHNDNVPTTFWSIVLIEYSPKYSTSTQSIQIFSHLMPVDPDGLTAD